jgi:methionine-rich copper-binding protein CopC
MRLRIPCFLLIFLIIMVIPASAHGFIERSEPQDGAVLDTSPQTVKVWFSEALQPGTGTINMVDGAGNVIEPTRVYHDSADDRLLVAELPPNLPDSAYIVTASAVVVSDAHAPSGSIVFWIGEKAGAAAAKEANSPAYGMVALFFGVMMAFVGAGITWNRRDATPLDIKPPDFGDSSTH